MTRPGPRPGRQQATGLLAAGLLAALAAGPALAQPRQAMPGPAPAGLPERTTAQFGDWVVNCIQPAGGTRLCEASLTIQDEARQASVTLAFGRTAKAAPLRLVARLPLGLRVAEPARLLVDPPAASLLPFTVCSRAGCFAELELRDDGLVRQLRARAAEHPVRLEWRDIGGGTIAMAVPVRGFAAAMDALGRETGG